MSKYNVQRSIKYIENHLQTEFPKVDTVDNLKLKLEMLQSILYSTSAFDSYSRPFLYSSFWKLFKFYFIFTYYSFLIHLFI